MTTRRHVTIDLCHPMSTIWSFTPGSRDVTRTMRRLFPDAPWHGMSMFVEQRFEVGAALALEREGIELRRAADGHAIRVVDGCFMLMGGT